MSRFTKKIGGRRRKHSRRNRHSKRRCLKKCKKCKKTMGKKCKKYCRRWVSKKYYGGSKPGNYILKPAGYSINTEQMLRGRNSSLANPPPHTAYKM